MGKWKQVMAYGKHIPSPLHNYIRNRGKATAILILDATFTPVGGEDRAILIAYDTGIGVIDYWIDETENKTAYHCIFNRLDQAGYKPICVISDGHASILPVIRERNLPHQRCIFHLLQELRRKLCPNPFGELAGRRKVLYSRIKWIFKTKTIEELPERIAFFRQHTEPLFPGEQYVLDWFWNIVQSAVLHLSYTENVPNTSNLLENLNGQIKARIKTMRGIKTEKSLQNLLKILFYFNHYKF
jgi:transposase-like protein